MNIWTAGTWDLLHHGHLSVINWCRRIAGKKGQVVVIVNTDEFIEEFKGRKPVLSYKEN